MNNSNNNSTQAKISNQTKISKLENYGLNDRFKNEVLNPEYSKFILARIISQHRGLYRVISELGENSAEISGKLRHDTKELAQFPTVGDWVLITETQSINSNWTIHKILTRKSIFLRSAVGTSGQAQVIASNIDIVFLCMSLNHNFNLNRLERYLAIAWDSGAIPVILLTKSDLCNNLEETVLEVEQVSNFCDVVTISMFDLDNIIKEKMSKYLKLGTTSAFIGSSGVGKSTIINKILGKELLATSEVGKIDKGRHTTTSKEMYLSPFGGVLIDTPGMRELGIETANLSKTFEDIEELANKCKFKNCTHTNEPNCQIIEALENNIIDKRRLNSYLKLKTETSYDGLTHREIENKKIDRMFKEVGGMKNARKFAKESRKRK